MAITTYAELQTACSNWLNRTDLTSRVPEFIMLAESRISKDLKIDQLEKRVTTSTVAAQEYYSLPSDCLSIVAVTVDSSPVHNLDYLPQDQMQAKYPDRPTGIPDNYSIIGPSVQMMPIPGSAYTMTMRYRAKVPALSGTNTSNWVLATHPELYLYGSLIEAEPFLRNDARMATWSGLYDRAVAAVKNADFMAPSNLSVRVA